MKAFPVALIIFGVVIILAPAILAYLIGGFFIFIGINLLAFFKMTGGNKEEYVKFGKYKIYK
ncbi:hypothetical protein A9Q91_00785 [Candidatus Gracilibacteria bacterium 28_42_T64]|nr:hypothetical protein A9Q91_00785 [Candidatus Gracilibacteria bacterium 28_42_T64]